MRDAFDLWWEWATKPVDSRLMIDGDIHYPVMELSPENRRDRQKVNEAVRRYREKSEMQHLNRRSRLPVQFVATWHALIAANGPFLRAVNRMFTFPLGEWRLRSDHAAHECESFGHRRVGHDFLNAHRLGAGTEQMAHHGNDGHEQCSLSPISSGAEI
jgi:hypothetical protein